MASSLTSGRPNSLAGTNRKSSALVAAGSEFYDCPRICAMFDKPYIARYERKAGKLFLVGTSKDEAAAGVGKGKHPAVTLRFDQLKTSVNKERCAWCGSKELVFCKGCSEFVCRAKTSKRDGGLFFRCRASCGTEGMTEGGMETFEASEQSAPSQQRSRLRLPEEKNLAALPSGKLPLKS